MSLADSPPLLTVTWTDPVTGKNGYLVVQSLVSNFATGGTRMRAGCTLSEVGDLARGMALKAAVFQLPVGGAKGGVDCDPKDPEAPGVMRRFVSAMRPWLDAHWVTAEDLGVPQHFIDEIFAELGMDQSYHAAISRGADRAATLARVREGLVAEVDGGFPLGDVIGGYGVAQSCLAAVHAWNWAAESTTVAVQGVGTMGGSAAFYLYEAGLKIVAVADAAGTLFDANGLDIPALLALRDKYGEIDRSALPESVTRLERDAVLSTEVDILVPAAISYAIKPANVDAVAAKIVVEAANSSIVPEAEATLAARGVPVLPDFVANAGAAAWAWWLLLGRVGSNPADSFAMLRKEMLDRIPRLIEAWDTDRTTPRSAAVQLADKQAADLTASQHPVLIP